MIAIPGGPYTGTIATWLDAKHFGFIAVDGDASRDCFVHIRDTIDQSPLREGDRVRFYIDLDRTNRPKAIRVELVELAK